MKLFKVWYQLPMTGANYYPPGWSYAHIEADSLKKAKATVNALIKEHQETVDESGFVIRNIEESNDFKNFAEVLLRLKQ